MAKKSLRVESTQGSPRVAIRDLIRLQRLRLAQISWKNRFLIILFSTFAFTLVSRAVGASYKVGLTVGLSITIFLFLLLLASDLLKMFYVIIPYALLTAPLGLAYTQAASSGQIGGANGDMIGGALALFTSFLFAIMIAVRYSRGKVWFTTALVGASTLLPGLLFLLVVPSLGLNAARLSMALVLIFRCGGWDWISGLSRLAIYKLKKEEHEEEDTLEKLESLKTWEQRAQVEKDASLILQNLSRKDYAVFQDMKIKGSNNPLGHLIIGPSGATLIASVYSKGPLKEDSEKGITLPKIALDKTVGSLIQQRESLAKILKCAERDLSLLIVIHGLGIPAGRKSIAIFSPDNRITPSGQVSLVDIDHLLSEVSLGLQVWSKGKTKQAISRAKMNLHPAVYPLMAQEKESETPLLVPLDNDGHLMMVKNAKNIVPSWLVPGIPVNILTSKGILTSLRVTGTAVMDQYGYRVVPVCTDEEWAKANNQGRRPTSYNYPVACIVLP